MKEAKNTPERAKLDDTFGTAMKRGPPCSTHNVVIEFDDNRRIAPDKKSRWSEPGAPRHEGT